jgi:hypothetical protein
MTLIVAEVTDDDAFVVADTLITYDYQPRDAVSESVYGNCHALKVHILHPAICVAISGEFDIGLRTVEAFKNSGLSLAQENPSRLADMLLNCYQNAGADVVVCDFLLLVARPDGNHLFKLADGKIFQCQRAYIGDADGYRSLQDLRKPYEAPVRSLTLLANGLLINEPNIQFGLEQSFQEQASAMEALAASRKFEAIGVIGDNVIRVRISKISDGFEYLQQYLSGSSIEDGWIGAYLLAQNCEPYAVGIYYLGGQFGFVMSPGKYVFCQKIRSATLDGFVQAVVKQFGYRLV